MLSLSFIQICYAIIGVIAIYRTLDRIIRLFYLGGNENRYILVTGCDTGFGNLVARKLDKLGCHVFAGCLTEAGVRELTKECSKNLVPLRLDVSDSNSVHEAYETVKAALPKGKGLWGLLNNAGIAGVCAPHEWLTLEDYKDVAAVNLYGLIDVTMTFLPLIKLERGRIVNTSSIYGRHSSAIAAPYCTSKYGVEAFVDSLRRGMRSFGVKAILIEPGFFKTSMPLLRNTSVGTGKAWNRASQQIRDEYGENFYNCLVKKGLGGFEAMCSERFYEVVNALVHGLLGRFPRARYVVGHDANYFWWPIQMLPEWLGDLVLEKAIGLDPPAATVREDSSKKTT